MQEPVFYCAAALLYLAAYLFARKSVRATTRKSLNLFNAPGILLETISILVRRARKLPTYSRDQFWGDVLGLNPTIVTPNTARDAGDAMLDAMRRVPFAYPASQRALIKGFATSAEHQSWWLVERAEEDLLMEQLEEEHQQYMRTLTPRQLAVEMLNERGYGRFPAHYARSFRGYGRGRCCC